MKREIQIEEEEGKKRRTVGNSNNQFYFAYERYKTF